MTPELENLDVLLESEPHRASKRAQSSKPALRVCLKSHFLVNLRSKIRIIAISTKA